MLKKDSPAMLEIRSLLPYFLALNAVYFGVLTVLFFALGHNWTYFTGALYGDILCAANFYLLGLTAEKSLTKGSPKAAQTYMNTMYCLRYLGLFLAMTAAAVIPAVDLISALVPLFFPKLAITIRTFFDKKEG